ncbi:NlpC/P60 family protein [uncultured Celeribacter sp.]|uniref:NlpC/P60 family protein n=1 Tax=uncultured Celeribacter sp. TaxID=1303376 RepID=UPI002AA77BC2|nr:NlpC/P60 family protein [uncultured Celeribacter sp.]
MTWSDRFIGIPQVDGGRSLSGVDNCWVLGCVIFREELHISLPDYLGKVCPDEQDEVAALIEGEKSSPLWLPVDGLAIAFDIALFRMGRYTSHVGIVVKNGLMIHVHGEGQSKIERYDAGRWSHRFEGHFRHRERAVKHPVQLIERAAR